MIGTIINVVAIILGGLMGLLLGSRLPERIKQTVVSGIGLFTMVLGVKMFLDSHNVLVVLGSILIGGILGEWLQIEMRLAHFGVWLESKVLRKAAYDAPGENNFVKGFMTSSLLFVIGPVAILGSIQDGLSGDYSLLAVKSILDGVASIAFASTLGVGVIFSIIPIFLYQGGITLLASQVQGLISASIMNEISAVGGIILLGIGISTILEIKQIRTGNFLPALIIVSALVVIFTRLGLY